MNHKERRVHDAHVLTTVKNTARAGLSAIRPLAATAAVILLFFSGCNKPTTAVGAGGPDNKTAAGAGPAASAGHKFVAYYFHRTLRCPTCLSIEKQSRETVETRFKGALDDGRLAWQAVDIQSPGNGHFEQDFQLQAQALILVEMKDGKVARWKNLPKVWDLVDKPGEFQEYVSSELTAFIGS
jgi:hypothetical protein